MPENNLNDDLDLLLDSEEEANDDADLNEPGMDEDPDFDPDEDDTIWDDDNLYDDLDDDDFDDEDDDYEDTEDAEGDTDVFDELDEEEYEVTDLDEERAPEADAIEEETQEPVEGDGPDKDAIIKKLRKENAARREKLREAREANVGAVEQGVSEFTAQLTSELGLQVESGDSAAIIEAINAERAALREDAEKSRRDLEIFKAAHTAGASTAKLADSKSFTNTVKELDPSSDTYSADVLKAVRAAVKENPTFKEVPSLERFGGDFTGGTPTPRTDDNSVDAFIASRRKRLGAQ